MRIASLGSQNAFKHGFSRTPIGNAWYCMMKRCYDPKYKQYKDYGGRGIKVCDRWHKIENFAADMEKPPKGLWLDRIDNDGNYEPGNCRWATPTEQLRNTRRSRFVQCGDFRATVGEWAEVLGMNYNLIYKRIFRRNWPIDLALTFASDRKRRVIGLIVFAAIFFLGWANANAQMSTQSFRLSWTDNSVNEEGFYIYRDNVKVATVGMNVTTFTDTVTGVWKQQICYAVSAMNHQYADGTGNVQESAKSNTACGTIPVPLNALPLPPSGLTTAVETAALTPSIRLSWGNDDPSVSEFQYTRMSWSPRRTVRGSIDGGLLTYVDTDLRKNETYCYRLNSINEWGMSENSNESCSTTPR